MSTLTLKPAIPVYPVKKSRYEPGAAQPRQFGDYISDHMFMCDFNKGRWQEPAIVPYGNMSLSPAALALHYGQSVFEGMKAYKTADGSISIFRIERHYDRFRKSLERMCMPSPGFDMFRDALIELVKTDSQWVPETEGASLYIRPLVFASEPRFGVKVSDEYRFVILTGPVPALFAKPIRVKVETHFHRAVPGGTGYAKCAGNYGGSFYPTQLAREQGFDQVIWTSAGDEPYVEESGMMNLIFVINDTVVTAPNSDTILDGVTRDSLLTLAKDKGWEVEERPISVRELEDACRTQQLREAFGAGTAAVVAPIGHIQVGEKLYQLPEARPNARMYQLRDELHNIQLGLASDAHRWNTVVAI